MKEGAVTLLDVLGWKGIWQRRPDAIQALRGTIDLIRDIQEMEVRDNSRYAGLTPAIWGISDTIALTTYGEASLVLPFHAMISRLLLSFSLTNEFALRGATSYGWFYSEDNMLVGPAVDEVASWYEAVDWIGVIYAPSAFLHSILDSSIGADYVRPYKVKVKAGGSFETLCVDWPDGMRNKDGTLTNTAKNLVNLFLKSQPITPDLAGKLSNTLTYLENGQGLRELTREEHS
jgi:hypothetical protein